jgi:ABC transport system ATP-binding/permease protein
MSEEILKALTQLFAIIGKQDGGVTENERTFVIRFFQQELDQDSVKEYIELYDDFSGYRLQQIEGIDKSKQTSVKDSVKTLGICRKINKTLTQKQKVIVLIKLLEMVALEEDFTAQPMEIINTVANVFNIGDEEYKLIHAFVIAGAISELNLSDVLIVNSGDGTEGGEALKNKHTHAHIEGHLVFIRVRSVDLYFARYLGEASNILNSFTMQPNRVYLFSHGSTIKTPSGIALYYGDLVSNFNEELKTARLSFHANVEEYKFANGAVGLRNVGISEGPGKLIGIMGASGAGKTTLLNVLAGLEKPSKGEILVNGINIHTQKEKIHGVIGYVAQDDLLIEELTVYQNLYYNARLCFSGLSEEDLHKKVIKVLENLGLEQRKDLKVGSVLDKTISGGQRKRLNIALELIREPAILFLDEPTSGLSSRDSENVIDLLKEISLKGKLVFVVIHQPSSDIYKMFDKMIIMDTGGYPAYYGTPVEAVGYFKKATHQVDSNRGQCELCGNVNPEQIFNIIEAKVVDEYGQPTAKRKVTPPQWYEMYKGQFAIPHLEVEMELPPQNLSIPGKIKQTTIFAIRDLLSKISNRQYLLINLLEAPLLAMILAFIIRYKSAPDKTHYVFRFNDNFPAFLLMGIIVALFMGLTVSAEEIIRDRKILRREAFLNLSWNSYILSKIGILFLLSAIQTFMFVIISNAILQIHGMTLAFWFILFTTSCFANVLGLNISSGFNSAVTVYVLIPLLLIPQMILSGLLFRFDKLNDLISAKGTVPMVADLMVSRWAYEALAVHQFIYNEYEKSFYEYEKGQSIADFKAAYLADNLKQRDAFVWDSIKTTREQTRYKINNDISILLDELENEPFGPAIQEKHWNERIQLSEYSKSRDTTVQHFLGQYKRFYQQEYNRQGILLDKKMAFYQNHGWDITENKDRFYNDALADLVKNINAKERMLEYNGRIIQQSDPIFQDPKPRHFYDYRSAFFFPRKNLAGFLVDTYWFNAFVIWIMSALLYCLLRFEVLHKLLSSGGKIASKKSRFSWPKEIKIKALGSGFHKRFIRNRRTTSEQPVIN